MKIAFNPPPAGVKYLCASSAHNAAKWIKNKATGDMIYWPAEEATHAAVASTFGVDDYEKGIAVPTEQ